MDQSSTVPSNIGRIIAGSVILTAVYFLSPIPLLELAQWAAMVLLPIFAIGVAIGFISIGTVQLILNGTLVEKIKVAVEEERHKRQERRFTKEAA